MSAQAPREALQYLKEREAIPQQIRESALGQLASVYGIPVTQQQRIAPRMPGSEGLRGLMPRATGSIFAPVYTAVSSE